MSNAPNQELLSDGFSHRFSLSGHFGSITVATWSPEGQRIATGSEDESVILWNVQKQARFRTLQGHVEPIQCLAWCPDGRVLASGATSIRLNDTFNGEWIRTIGAGHGTIHSVSWSPDGTLLAAGVDGRILLWNPVSGRLLAEFAAPAGPVISIVWSRDGRSLAFGGNNFAWIYDISLKTITRRFPLHSARVLKIDWSPDGALFATGLSDDTIIVWDFASGQPTRILEGHTGGVSQLSFSHDGSYLASGADDVRIWRCDTWEVISVVKAMRDRGYGGGLSFSPFSLQLASVGPNGRELRIWDLDSDRIRNATPVIRTVRYTNAKVVMVGDSGVGKSGLGIVLGGHPFRATESTHGRRVYTLETTDADLPGGNTETRELLLWDMAGQPGYRLIHQLHLNEVTIALVVFDARSETDPFAGVRHWDRALRQSQRIQGDGAMPLKKFLVAARIDRGGIGVGSRRIQRLVDDLGFEGYYETSAKDGRNIEELRNAARSSVDWECLPKVSSNDLFQRIKTFLIFEKVKGRVLSTTEDLYRAFLVSGEPQSPSERLRSQFVTCIGRVESRDLIKRLSFGDLVLLQPELLDSYASAIVNAAKEEPDGLGCIAEEDAKAGRFSISEDERLPDPSQEALLLIATVEGLIRHEIALRETTAEGVHLVFPSQLTRENPDLPDPQGKAVVLYFDGPVVAVYATLAVRLCRSGLFVSREMWKNAIVFDAKLGGSCGMVFREMDEGRGELTLFFDNCASKETRSYFESYIASHLERCALPETIKRKAVVSCPGCGLNATDQLLSMLASRSESSFDCPVCKVVVEIPKDVRTPETNVTVVTNMNQAADESREKETSASIIQGKRATEEFDVFLCYNTHDHESVLNIGDKLQAKGVLPWIDTEELRPGLRWQQVLEQQIKRVKAVAVFVGRRGLGPWQDQEQQAFIREFMRRDCPVIPVVLPGCRVLPELPIFLQGFNWVDFRRTSPDPIERLIWGITGSRPSK